MSDDSPELTSPPQHPVHRERPVSIPRSWFAALFSALVIAGAICGSVAIGDSQRTPADAATITVTGSATVKGTPNTVSFSLGISTTSSTAVRALFLNNGRIARLERALTKVGVTKPDMQTSGLNIYDTTNDVGDVTGYVVNDSLNITMHDLTHAGRAIDLAARIGGNGVQFNGVSFSISNQSLLRAKARLEAMQHARADAQQLASAGGASVSGLIKITPTETETRPIFYPFDEYALAANVAAVPLEAGTQSVTESVTVVYSLSN